MEEVPAMREQLIEENAIAKADTSQAERPRDRGLLLIAVFKLLKSVFFFSLGIGAIKMLHKDLGDEAMRLATALRFDPEGRVVSLLLSKVDLIDAHRLREIGFGVFAYSALACVEGIGLWLEKAWAEYLTLGLTVLFLPWELFEFVRRPGWGRVSLLVFNLLILAYLLWLLQRKKRAAMPAPSPAQA